MRTFIVSEIEKLSKLTDIKVTLLLPSAGISRSKWYEWKTRSGQETKHNANVPKNGWLLPWEREVIRAYCEANKDMFRGYRYLAWLMIDENVAYASPATVYNIMKKNGLISKWNKSGEEHEKGYKQPEKPNEQWHTDFSYIRIGAKFYYFSAVLDGYSRKILVWDLFDDMKEYNVELLITRAKELYPNAKPRIIHDNGKQYVGDDFKNLLALLEIADSRTRPFHPQSNGKIERFHRTLKTEHVRRTPYVSASYAEIKMAEWITWYNSERLNGAIFYLTPDEVFDGKMGQRLAERKKKLYDASIKRQEYWRNQSQLQSS